MTTTDERTRTLTEPTPTGADGEGSAGNIDQIRDIIFGAQMKEYERRFVRLEERLLKASTDLREELGRRLDQLEQYIRRETEALAGSLSAEQQARSAGQQQVASELATHGRGTTERFAGADARLAEAERSLRAQLLEQSRTLGDDLQRRSDDLTGALAREAALLRDSKTDRAALAAMFAEVARRLADEPTR